MDEKELLYKIVILTIAVCIILISILYYKFNNSPEFTFTSILPIILVVSLIAINESLISLIPVFGVGLLFAKFIISYNVVNNYNDYSLFNNISDILQNASNDNNIYISVLKKYLPIMVMNGLLMIALYVIFTTNLCVNLSLASNCAKSNYTVEYTTLRKKINEFAKNNDNSLKLHLIVMIISFLCTLGTIFYLLYTDIVEIQYIMIIPILIFLIIFAYMVIDKIYKNYFDNDKGKTAATSVGSILSYFILVITLPIITLFGVSLFIV